MASVRPLLERLWSELRQASISEGVEILEYIAAMLLEQEQINIDADREMPKRPPIRYGRNEQQLKSILKDATEQAGGAATLFDEQVLFYSTRVQGKEKSAYPTPRHIVKFMLSLLAVEAQHRLGDFACGSGGFLVHRDDSEASQREPGSRRREQSIGIELSPSWARLARANMAFHDMLQPGTNIYADNTFSLFTNPPESLRPLFDRIAMAPPFDTPIDALSARKAIGSYFPIELERTEAGYNSDVLFTWLLLSRLNKRGKGIIMVPVGLLHRRQITSALLRQKLMQSHELEAVIALNKGTLAPYSNDSTYLLLVNKENAEERTSTWFFKIERDGYVAEQSRDLTEELQTDPASNDLPFVQMIVRPDTQSKQEQYSATCPHFKVQLLGKSGQTRGVVIFMQEQVASTSIKRYQVSEGPKQRNYLFVGTEQREDTTRYWEVRLPDDSTHLVTIHSMVNERTWKRNLEVQGMKEVTASLLFTNGEEGQQIAISNDGRLLGLTQTWQKIGEKNNDLQPESYIPPSEGLVESAALLLSNVRRDHRVVTRIVDNLLGNLEIQQRLGKPLPPRPYTFEHDTFSLTQFLGPEQKAIYEQIESLSKQAHGYANYFTPEQIKLEDTISIKQTLELLEHLGLIVKVLIRDQTNEASANYYRLITDLDVTSI